MNEICHSAGCIGKRCQCIELCLQPATCGVFFCRNRQVIAVRADASDLVVDVMPLLAHPDENGNLIEPSVIYNLPVWRLQRGNSAIIMNPVVGDIGHILICDRDTSRVRASRKTSLPSTGRRHNRADGIYMGGILNRKPTQLIEFADSAINITSPGNINITCQSATVTAPDGINVNTPHAHFAGDVTANGNITDNVGTQRASLKALREAYNRHTHEVQGVESGDSHVASDKPGDSV